MIINFRILQKLLRNLRPFCVTNSNLKLLNLTLLPHFVPHPHLPNTPPPTPLRLSLRPPPCLLKLTPNPIPPSYSLTPTVNLPLYGNGGVTQCEHYLFTPILHFNPLTQVFCSTPPHFLTQTGQSSVRGSGLN